MFWTKNNDWLTDTINGIHFVKLRRYGRKPGKSKKDDDNSEDRILRSSESRGKILLRGKSFADNDELRYMGMSKFGDEDGGQQGSEEEGISSSEDSVLEPLCDVIDSQGYGLLWEPMVRWTIDYAYAGSCGKAKAVIKKKHEIFFV